MVMKYFVVLFKNKERKKIINKFKTYDRALEFFNKKIKNNDVKFNKEFENGEECFYELGLLEKESQNFNSYFVKDSYGRQIKAELDTNEYKLLQIKDFKVADLIQDVSLNKKIDFDTFEKRYLKKGGLKLISKINNKVVVQEDDSVNLFSLKTPYESERFLKVLNSKLIEDGRMDVLIVLDTSKEQKKYLYGILEENGIPKSVLYRTFTTFPKKTIS